MPTRRQPDFPAPAPAFDRARPGLVDGQAQAARTKVGPAASARELWLALHLPYFMLDALGEALPYLCQGPSRTSSRAPVRTGPIVVVDVERDGKVVRMPDAVAAAAGITPGMSLNTALALMPELEARPRDRRRERALLDAVAEACLRFTPRVSLEAPDAVLLEVRPSLRLFGGARRLCQALLGHLRGGGLEPQWAMLPTPLASLWTARSGRRAMSGNPAELARRLADLPIGVSRWPDRALETLATMGVRTVGECLRLPRDGFSRRFEPRMRRDLDRALGRAADPRARFMPEERYVLRRDFEPEIVHSDRLRLACAPLLEQLCLHLRGRGASVQALEFQFLHREARMTRVRLRFAEPVNDVARIDRILAARLERLALEEPARAVRMRSGRFRRAAALECDLFAQGSQRDASIFPLVDSLRARLGHDAVYGLRLVPEHRPEAAQVLEFTLPLPGQAGAGRSPRPTSSSCFRQRPVWLLESPQALEGDEEPFHYGPLVLEDEPERIESGWWDGHDVCRDYYVARTRSGAQLWIFRERRPQGRWFLHGLFG